MARTSYLAHAGVHWLALYKRLLQEEFGSQR